MKKKLLLTYLKQISLGSLLLLMAVQILRQGYATTEIIPKLLIVVMGLGFGAYGTYIMRKPILIAYKVIVDKKK